MNYLLKQSLQQQIPIEMIYMKKNGECTKRKIIVQRQTDQLIQAYCLSKKTMRTFRNDCILALAPIKLTRSSAHAVS
ncbi:WYL domain-containing protein [Bacillus pumilus]|uniref:WYL domain-containing protein n=1 Tax=Bacillus pumilus TaxID=1408 RepID=UPI001C24AB2D|nr:WYL domain-containing protein [Bacillus pumilus]MBU8637841.1 WYL domain-containing protein [Bacillus pumilus]